MFLPLHIGPQDGPSRVLFSDELVLYVCNIYFHLFLNRARLDQRFDLLQSAEAQGNIRTALMLENTGCVLPRAHSNVRILGMVRDNVVVLDLACHPLQLCHVDVEDILTALDGRNNALRNAGSISVDFAHLLLNVERLSESFGALGGLVPVALLGLLVLEGERGQFVDGVHVFWETVRLVRLLLGFLLHLV